MDMSEKLDANAKYELMQRIARAFSPSAPIEPRARPRLVPGPSPLTMARPCFVAARIPKAR